MRYELTNAVFRFDNHDHLKSTSGVSRRRTDGRRFALCRFVERTTRSGKRCFWNARHRTNESFYRSKSRNKTHFVIDTDRTGVFEANIAHVGHYDDARRRCQSRNHQSARRSVCMSQFVKMRAVLSPPQPARRVIVLGIKFGDRELTASRYRQMCGRAGSVSCASIFRLPSL